jgi:acylpyruvate hydrolase
MRLVTFATGGDLRRPRLGALVGGPAGASVVDLAGAFAAWRRTESELPGAAEGVAGDTTAFEAGTFPAAMLAFLQAGEPARTAARDALAFAAQPESLSALTRIGLAFPAAAVSYLPPIPRPGKIICLGLNYRTHVLEMKREMPQYPTLFAKFANTLVGHREPIVLPSVSRQVDYEGELAVVIGRGGKHIPKERAFDSIAGFAPFNDVTARDYQRRTLQWLQGKTFDSSGPMGPAIVTLDEIAHPQTLDLTTRLNGEVMQQANTSDFIFDIPTIVAYVTQFLTLEPGDIISTGTPSGVGDARQPQVFLQPGDVVEVEIGEVGTLTNPVVAPKPEPEPGPEPQPESEADD